MSDYRLRLIEDYVNQLLHPEGYHLRLWRYPDKDLVEIVLSKMTLSFDVLGDQCPVVKGKEMGRTTVMERELRG